MVDFARNEVPLLKESRAKKKKKKKMDNKIVFPLNLSKKCRKAMQNIC